MSLVFRTPPGAMLFLSCPLASRTVNVTWGLDLPEGAARTKEPPSVLKVPRRVTDATEELERCQGVVA